MGPGDTRRSRAGLTLLFPADTRARLEAHPALRTEEAPDRWEEWTEAFDTEGGALERAGFGLWLRRSGGSLRQVLQSPPGPGLLAPRTRWEWEVAGLDRAVLMDTPAAELLAGAVLAGAALAGAVLTGAVLAGSGDRPLRCSRSGRLLELADGTLVRAVFTGRDGEPDGYAPGELELELVEGAAWPLFCLAASLDEAAPLRMVPSGRPGAAWPPAAAARAATDPVLACHGTAGEGFGAVLDAALGDLVRNQPAAAAGNAEGVHQMRVAIRRLRAILVLFEPLLEPDAAAGFEDRLGRLGRVLGHARDWDVFLGETLPAVFGSGLLAGAAGHPARLLAEGADRERAAAYGHMEEWFAAPGLSALVLGLAAWAGGGAGRRGSDGMADRLEDAAPALLDRSLLAVRKRGRKIAGRSDAELHRLRKSLKKLRYGVEALAGLYGGRPVRRFLKPCKALQELLGEVNDGTVAVELAERLGEGDAALAPAVGAVRRWGRKRRKRGGTRVADAWAKVKGADAFWS